MAGFRAALPHATVFVYDNNSTDGTVAAARAAGAVVRRETSVLEQAEKLKESA